jgi:hypothetical protein
MLTPIGSTGGKGDIPVTKTAPGALEVSEVAQDAIENPILGKAELKHVKMSPKDKVTKRVTTAAFTEFTRLNKAKTSR